MIKKTIISILYFLPVLTLATGNNKNVEEFIKLIAEYINQISKILFAAVVVAFFYGLFLFMIDDEKKEKGKEIMIWGIIFIFVMTSIWGIIYFLQLSIFGKSESNQNYSDLFDIRVNVKK